MKKILSLLLCAVLLAGCGSNTVVEVTAGAESKTQTETAVPPAIILD